MFVPNYFRCSSNLSMDLSPFGRIYYVLRTFHRIDLPSVELLMFSEQNIGFDSRYLYRSCICLRHLRQNTASGSNVQGIVSRMIILWESLREKWFCWKTILVKPIIDRRDKVDVRANRCLHQWATKQSLYQMMSHTQHHQNIPLHWRKLTTQLTQIVLKI